MTSLAAYSKRPYVSFTERMREQALLRQQMQNEAEQRAYTQQKNALDLAQAEENLRQAQSGFGQNVPSAIQEYNFIQRLSPQERALFLRAKSPYSKIPFETMGMTGDMGDMGQQDMVAPPMQQGGMPSGLDNLDADINQLARTTAPVVQGPPMPTQRKSFGQGRMPEGAPLPPQEFIQGPPMPTQGAPLPPTQNGNINTAQTTKIAPPVDLGNGEFGFAGKRGYNEKTALLAYRSALAVEAAEQKERNELKINLPTVEKSAKFAIEAIENLEKSKGLPAIVGNPFSMSKIGQGALPAGYYFRGSQAANATTALGNVTGIAFLEAYNILRGAQGITEKEGEKGTAALANLNTAQDIDEFRKNLKVLKEVIKNGLVVARQRAGVLPTTQGAAQPMMPAGGNIIQTSHGPVTRE